MRRALHPSWLKPDFERGFPSLVRFPIFRMARSDTKKDRAEKPGLCKYLRHFQARSVRLFFRRVRLCRFGCRCFCRLLLGLHFLRLGGVLLLELLGLLLMTLLNGLFL